MKRTLAAWLTRAEQSSFVEWIKANRGLAAFIGIMAVLALVGVLND